MKNSPNTTVKRDCETGVVSSASLFRAATSYLGVMCSIIYVTAD